MKSTQEIFELERSLLKLENLHASFDYLRISIASPKRIRSWSERTLPTGEVIGEVIRPETINFRTHQPEMYGLFCEKIFGPIKNWKCRCGKYNGFAIDKICDECQVEIIETRVRRYRMGYIELTCPITHSWYSKGVPNYLSTILSVYGKVTAKVLDSIIYLTNEDKDKNGEIPVSVLDDFIYTNNQINDFNSLLKSKISSFQQENTNLIFSKKARLKKRKGSEVIKAAL